MKGKKKTINDIEKHDEETQEIEMYTSQRKASFYVDATLSKGKVSCSVEV